MRARAPAASLTRPALSAAVQARAFPPLSSGRRICSRSAVAGGVASDAGPTAGTSAQSEQARCARDYFPKMRDCATGIDGATCLLSGAPEGITYNGSNSAKSVGSVLDPNLRRKVIGSIHRRQRLVTHRRRTRHSKSFSVTVLVDRPPGDLWAIESLPPHGHAVLVLTVVFRIMTRNFPRLVPHDICGDHDIVLLVGVSGGFSAQLPRATIGCTTRPINARRFPLSVQRARASGCAGNTRPQERNRAAGSTK